MHSLRMCYAISQLKSHIRIYAIYNFVQSATVAHKTKIHLLFIRIDERNHDTFCIENQLCKVSYPVKILIRTSIPDIESRDLRL